ncbi:hypothetical protein TGDOM2_265400 [Toxoplasma gondii GAB2-2007-GAL-DOM2]|uniref:Uncharacterized protein n=5 Tax=Toxoplasma gondii TaxID=5811 RepID=S7UI23_TOXGG|nr:hypothetical protein TGGT1_265400 [Toxoplasma gondii GT1]KAF4644216.1 hypothetical protein TGRH88_012080 [Toxoplasma gondii]KFG38555.1 hypothetical protein TGDOM2_265400 [Toxoplasma gondii GAB2-2007-GAL-DOM2]KFG42143.1 hypothetical protein TGFOU_265400 [Toxoplasma gondii FOU]RQX74006.1 hypothetical protein TGCAST_265400 [Toxoplasma gondii CAST]
MATCGEDGERGVSPLRASRFPFAGGTSSSPREEKRCFGAEPNDSSDSPRSLPRIRRPEETADGGEDWRSAGSLNSSIPKKAAPFGRSQREPSAETTGEALGVHTRRVSWYDDPVEALASQCLSPKQRRIGATLSVLKKSPAPRLMANNFPGTLSANSSLSSPAVPSLSTSSSFQAPCSESPLYPFSSSYPSSSAYPSPSCPPSSSSYPLSSAYPPAACAHPSAFSGVSVFSGSSSRKIRREGGGRRRIGKGKQRRWVSHQLLVAALRRCMYESGEDVTDTETGLPGEELPKPSCWQRLQRNAAAYDAFRRGKEETLLGAQTGRRERGAAGEEELLVSEREEERALARLARKVDHGRRRRQQKLRQNRQQQRQLLSLIREQKLGRDRESPGAAAERRDTGDRRGDCGGADSAGESEEHGSGLSSLEEQQALLRYLRRQEEQLIEEILRDQERAQDLALCGVRTSGALRRSRGQLRPSVQLLRGIRVSFRHVKAFLADSVHHQNFLRCFERQLLRVWPLLGWTDTPEAALQCGKEPCEEARKGGCEEGHERCKREVAAECCESNLAVRPLGEVEQNAEKTDGENEAEEGREQTREEGEEKEEATQETAKLSELGGVRVAMFRVRKGPAAADGNYLSEIGVGELTSCEEQTLHEFLKGRHSCQFLGENAELDLDENDNSACPPSPPDAPASCLDTASEDADTRKEKSSSPAPAPPRKRRDSVFVVWGLDGLQRKLLHGCVALVDDVVSCSVQVESEREQAAANAAFQRRETAKKKRRDEKAVIVLLRGSRGQRDTCLSGPPLFSPANEFLAALGVPSRRRKLSKA